MSDPTAQPPGAPPLAAPRSRRRRADKASPPQPTPGALDGLEAALGHRFSDRNLLLSALTHRSFANDHHGQGVTDYQRLEFLGDAVVGCVMADLLYRRDPKAREGTLTLRRAALVKEARLAEAARVLALPPLIRVGQGDEAKAFPERDSVLADVFEALIAALWLDAGQDALPRIEALLTRLFGDDLAGKAPSRALKPPKSRLQELSQERWKITPRYRITGEPTDGDLVEVALVIGDVLTLTATGQNRRDAENSAALAAIAHLEGETVP
jgi:ribonuclease-3